MCGIVGYIGYKDAKDIILSGLEKLEYRGYDSAGIALNTKSSLVVEKTKGRIGQLRKRLSGKTLESNVGIGHTRWATHGAPTQENAHPHLNESSTIAVVHNGIIENYQYLKKKLIKKGYTFKSDTDTEVIAHYIDSIYDGDLLMTVKKAVKSLKGSYSLGIISSNHPDEIIAVRKESPLIVGIGDRENYIASDIPAILEYTNKVYFLENDEIVQLKNSEVKIYNKDGQEVNKEVFEVNWDIHSASKGGYEHYTLKEIFEQSAGVSNTLIRRITDDGRLRLDDIKLKKDDVDSFSKIYIVACGTSYHAGLIGKKMIERFTKLPVETNIASEFRYAQPFIDARTLLIVISQSGETADTLAAIREAKSKGARVLSITNVVGSSIARESDDVLYTWAGPEIGVCSTKAYTTQLMAMYMLSLHLAYLRKTISDEEYLNKIDSLKKTGDFIDKILEEKKIYIEIAKKIKNNTSAFYIGRGLDYQTALEGALKLKEISYIHAEAFAAGELKHGTIALIEDMVPVITIATQEKLVEKTLSNMEEVKARGAFNIAIVQERDKDLFSELANILIIIPNVDDLFAPIISVVPTQLIAYYTALIKGNDVDKPRNLAKSVTVE